MIINIRATHGAGKSHFIRDVMKHADEVKHLDINEKNRAQNYELWFQELERPTYLIGNYDISCGGCDAIQPYSLIWPRVESFIPKGNVLFEGALVSSSYGKIGTDSEKYGDEFVFAFLNTPLKLCIKRIKQRRAAKGNTKPFDPGNTSRKYKSVERSKIKMKERNRRIEILPYKDPLPKLMELLKEGE